MNAEPTDYDIRQFFVEQGVKFVELSNRFSIVCPFHDDHDASATLYKDRKYFECFACGKKYFFKTWYKVAKGKSWDDGRELILTRPKQHTIELSSAMRRTVDFEDGVITSVYDNVHALEYCRSRGVNDEFIKTFNLSASELCKINGKVWVNRLLIPVKEDGKDYSLEGRDYRKDQKAKCLYPKDSPIDTLFNIDGIDYSKPLVVVEGTMDLHKIWQHVTKNVVATFGIMIPSKQQDILKKHSDLILFIDDDKAGRQSISIFEKFMPYNFRVAIVRGEDPGSSTIPQLEQAISEAKPFGKFLIDDLGIFPEKEKISLSGKPRNYLGVGKPRTR